MRKVVFVGCDVAMLKLDLCFTVDGIKYDSLEIFNNESSILGFLDYLVSQFPKHIFYFGYEATSTYMVSLQKVLTEKGHKQIMINPYEMSHYLKHLNSRKKTDALDSLGITKYIQTLQSDDFKTVYSLGEKTLRKYTSCINLLRKLDTQLKNFIHAQKITSVPMMDILIDALVSKIKETKKDLEKQAEKLLLELYPHIKKIKDDIKGVGYALLLELVPIFLKSQNYTIKQLQSFVGLSPRLFESGSSIHKKEKMSKRGSSLIRKLLYLSTMSAIRFNDIIEEKYNRLVESGKNKMVALVACMSHLFRAVYYKFQKGF